MCWDDETSGNTLATAGMIATALGYLIFVVILIWIGYDAVSRKPIYDQFCGSLNMTADYSYNQPDIVTCCPDFNSNSQIVCEQYSYTPKGYYNKLGEITRRR